MFAHAHPGDVAEAQGVQRVLHRLALGVEQGGAGHHAHLDAERAHPWPPRSRSRGAMPRGGGPDTSLTAAPSASTIRPARAVPPASSPKKEPSIPPGSMRNAK